MGFTLFAVFAAGYGTVAGAWAGSIVGAVLLFVSYAVENVAPSWWFERPDPKVTLERHVEDGVSDEQAMRRFATVVESEDLRAERIQEERRKAKQKANRRGRNR